MQYELDVEMSKSKEELNDIKEEEERESQKKYELQITEDLEEFAVTQSEMSEAAPEDAVGKATKKRSAESKAGSKHVPSKKRPDPRTLGPVREPVPWEWITLNKCLMVASFVALLSMGFQVLQDVVEPDDELPEVVNHLLVQPESIPPEALPEDEPELWFFERWFEASEPEEEEAEEMDEVVSTPVAVKESLKKRLEKSKDSRKPEDEVSQPRPAKQKTDSTVARLEKPKPEKTSKAPFLPRANDQQTKAAKPWKEAKEEVFRRQDKSSQERERKVREGIRQEKGRGLLKDRVEKGRPQQSIKQERSKASIHGPGEEHSKQGRKQGKPENGRRQEDRPQQEGKGPRKNNPSSLNGSSRPSPHQKFFPQKENEKRKISPKHRHEPFKLRD
ncbi:junctional sarcoplasmic reticulum protein 1 isoform X2 [Ambystoma mexicanum]|uniref:junctional sarcoplasmic reticulum protein 1 isoform X2 n=1 Tax=Ambystoma mexicanum TaxID=8296 RepID=UPI0037E93893